MGILRKGNTLGVCVHHSVYKPANNLAELKTQAGLFNSWHKSKSWAEDTKTPSAYPYISYHYLMATNGEMLRVTDEKYVKYHAGDNFRGDLSFNLHGIAVCLTGNYENDKPTDAQMKALVLFIRDVQKRYDINARVRGHKETSASATACPGKNIGTSSSGWLKQVISNVNDKNYPPPPPEPPQPPVTPPSEQECQRHITPLQKEIEALRIDLRNSEKALNLEKGKLKVCEERVEHLEGVLEGEREEMEKLRDENNKLTLKKQEYINLYTEAVKELGECELKLEQAHEGFIKKIVETIGEWLAKVLGRDD
jgi:hypothetical protein